MSLSKVQKQIHNLDPKLREVSLLRKIPVVLSDSKAKYLENVVDFKRHGQIIKQLIHNKVPIIFHNPASVVRS
jgi:hypothetical protein